MMPIVSDEVLCDSFSSSLHLKVVMEQKSQEFLLLLFTGMNKNKQTKFRMQTRIRTKIDHET